MRLLVLLFLLLIVTRPKAAQAQPGLLQRRVQLAVADQPLGLVLREVSRRSGVEFSYSNTLVPVHTRVTLHTAGAEPVASVLNALCESRGLSWRLVGSHVVLWRTAAGVPPALLATTQLARGPAPGTASRKQTDNSLAADAGPAGLRATGSRTTSPGRRGSTTAPGAKTATKQMQTAALSRKANTTNRGTVARVPARSVAPVRLAPAKPASESASNLPPAAPGHPISPAGALSETSTPTDSLDNAPARQRRRLAGLLQKQTQRAASGIARAARRVGQAAETSVETIVPLPGRLVRARSGLFPRDTLLTLLPLPAPTTPLHYEKKAQISLVSPLGTNALRSGRTSNGYSLNLLAGYAAGVRHLEIGGLLNVVRDTVRGVQLAGLANVVGTATRGVQAAGLVNVLGGSVQGLQAAGLANITRDDARGVQLAGLVNVVGGAATSRADATRPVRLRRWLGLPRLLATDPAAATPGAAGETSLPGPLVQAAGLANLTGTDVRGLQTAPLLNVGRRISGVQLGLVNVARHVRGTQFGLINIADSVDGVALGIFNIVRHGYRKGEVWASETLPLNAVLKLGVPRYYTILGAASQPLGTRVRWASGFGIGTSGRPHGRFTYSLDLVQWALTEPGQEVTGEARLLTQLRPALAWQIETNGHLQLVASPTLNFALAVDNTNPPTWDFGENQLLLLNRRTSSAIYRLWPGLQLGLRF